MIPLKIALERGRFDAEYHRPRFYRIEKAVLAHHGVPLERVVNIVKRKFNPLKCKTFTYIEINSVSPTTGQITAQTMPCEDAPSRAQQIVRTNDVIISSVRPNRNAVALITQQEDGFVCSSGFVVLRPKRVSPEYLFTYLKTRTVIDLLMRATKATMYPAVTENDILSLPFVLPDNALEREVTSAVKNAFRKLQESARLYSEAEFLLLSELGLDNLDLSHQLTYTLDFSQVWAAGRLDAEYFQPRYYRVLEALQALGPRRMIPLGEMLTLITNGHTPLRHNLSVGEVPFITAEFVSDFRIDYDSNRRILRRHHETELRRTALREGDLLVTIKGRIGNAAVVAHLPGDVNINQDVALLRLKKGYHPYYVAAFLNSEAGKALTDQVCTGQINPFLGLGNLKKVPIPVFGQKRMDKLGDKVQRVVESAYRAEQAAKRLLEEAKRRVEEMVLSSS